MVTNTVDDYLYVSRKRNGSVFIAIAALSYYTGNTLFTISGNIIFAEKVAGSSMREINSEN